MQKVQQKDLKVGQIVADVSNIDNCAIFEVVQRGSFTKSKLLLKYLMGDTFYGKISDENGRVSFGTNMLHGTSSWYLPTDEELELINKR